MAHFSKRVMPQWWRAVVLFVPAFCFAPTTARATCGDYVTIHTNSAKNNAKEGSQDHLPSALDQSDPLHSAPSSPCRGPNCSGSPVQNPLSPFSLPSTQPQPKECLKWWLREFDHGDHFCSSIPIPSTEALPTGSIASIDHPPREV
jgi:hypothetical protein